MSNLNDNFYANLDTFDEYLEDGRMTESGNIQIDFKRLFEFVNENYNGDISLMTDEEKMQFIIKPKEDRQVA